MGNALHTIGEGAGKGRRKKAGGFRLANLLKLKDTKAMDKQVRFEAGCFVLCCVCAKTDMDLTEHDHAARLH